MAGNGTDTFTGGVAKLTVEPGEETIVTYTDTKNARMQGHKNTISDNSTFTFDTDGTLNGQGSPAVPDPVSITTVGGTGNSGTFTFANLPAAGSSLKIGRASCRERA